MSEIRTVPVQRIALAGLLTAALAVLAASLSLVPRDGDAVAVLAVDGAGAIAAIGLAGGTVVDAPSTAVTIAMPGDARFVSRMRQQGYWFVLDARAAAGCSSFFLSLGGSVVRQS